MENKGRKKKGKGDNKRRWEGVKERRKNKRREVKAGGKESGGKEKEGETSILPLSYPDPD